MIADRPMLTLAELELHDPYPSGHGPERRFLCPFPACADHQRREHKNLTANIESGLWECKRCGASGRFAERWERPQPRPRVMRLGPYEKARRALGLASAPTRSPEAHGGSVVQHGVLIRTPKEERQGAGAAEATPAWRRRWEQAVPVAGTSGEAYLARRGIPIDIATAAGVRYLERWEHWTRDERGDWRLEGTSRRVVFPILNRDGTLIGIQGRKIGDGEHGEKMLTNGYGGIFVAGASWPLDQIERLAIVEAPIDALSLAAAGVATLATQGTSWPAWLPLALAFKKVLLAHDNDAPNAYGECAGELAAASLRPALRSYGAEPERLQPRSKDWNQDLQELGLEQLRRVIHGGRTIELVAATAAAEKPVEAGPLGASAEVLVSVASEAPVEGTVEGSCPGAEPVVAGERAEVGELLVWLQTAELPQTRFQLRPGVKVVDVPQFVGRLQAELSSATIGSGWRAAAEDLRQLARLYRGAVSEGCGLAQHERAPPCGSPGSVNRINRRPRNTANTGVAVARAVAALGWVSDSARLRLWQYAALERFVNHQQPGFLAVATPGAGKTTFALVAARIGLAERPAPLVVVTPTTHLKTRWAHAAARLYLHLDPAWSAADGGLPTDMHGVVTTYHQVALDPAAVRRLAQRAFVILDEVHHGGEDRAWGAGLQEAFGSPARRLSLSGTPFHSDTRAIPFVRYQGDEAVPDFEYSYGDALRDGAVVRPVYFPAVGGVMEWSAPDGAVYAASFDDPLRMELANQRLRTALSLEGQWLAGVLSDAVYRLKEVRPAQPNAGGLVIASDQEHAHRIGELLRWEHRVEATVVASDDPTASERIASFALGSSP